MICLCTTAFRRCPLGDSVAYLEDAVATRVTTELAFPWAQLQEQTPIRPTSPNGFS